MSSRFRCPECGTRSLQLLASIELGPGRDDDERTVQSLRCERCGQRAVGIYTESRGAEDSVHHNGHRLDAETFEELHGRLSRCPKPREPGCSCEAHQAYRRVDDNGRWVPLEGISTLGMFLVEV
jgi:hypothetical protein